MADLLTRLAGALALTCAGACSRVRSFDGLRRRRPADRRWVGSNGRRSLGRRWHGRGDRRGHFDGSLATTYVDGRMVGQAPIPTLPEDNGDLFRVDFAFAGDLDEMAVFDRSLTQSEIRAHLAAGR